MSVPRHGVITKKMAIRKYKPYSKRKQIGKKSGVLEKTLWDNFSKFIRLRDADWRGNVKCISCSITKHWKEMDAGHYIAVGACSGLKYNENNVHAQCTSCNRFKSGNQINYRLSLVRKLGEKTVKNLESIYERKIPSKKLEQFEINELNKKYKEKANKLMQEKCNIN